MNISVICEKFVDKNKYPNICKKPAAVYLEVFTEKGCQDIRKTAEQDQEPGCSELSALSRCKDMIGAVSSVILIQETKKTKEECLAS